MTCIPCVFIMYWEWDGGNGLVRSALLLLLGTSTPFPISSHGNPQVQQIAFLQMFPIQIPSIYQGKSPTKNLANLSDVIFFKFPCHVAQRSHPVASHGATEAPPRGLPWFQQNFPGNHGIHRGLTPIQKMSCKILSEIYSGKVDYVDFDDLWWQFYKFVPSTLKRYRMSQEIYQW